VSAAGSKRTVLAALAANLLIAVTKFVAAAVSGSSALFSEGIHSVVDTGNQALLLLGMRRARRPADEEHPFGHGREVYFWSFVVAILVFAAGAGVSLYEGVVHILEPEPIRELAVNYVVLGLAMVFEVASLWVAGREFRERSRGRGFVETVRESKDPTVYTVVLEDSAALAGVLLALAGNVAFAVTGDPRWDGLASVAIGVLLAGVAAWLARETQGLLIGEGARGTVLERIREVAGREEGIVALRDLRTMHLAPEEILVTLIADFEDDLPASEVERATGRLEARIRGEIPEVRWVFVEADGGTAAGENERGTAGVHGGPADAPDAGPAGPDDRSGDPPPEASSRG